MTAGGAAQLPALAARSVLTNGATLRRRTPSYDLVVRPDGAVSADLDIYYPQLFGERAGFERRAIHDRWRAEPADQCGDRDDVEFIDQAGPQEGAVEPAPGLRYEAPGAELRPDLRQRGRQIHPTYTGEQVGNPLLAQVGEIPRNRGWTITEDLN